MEEVLQMLNKAEYNPTKETWQSLAIIAANPTWSKVDEYIGSLIAQCHKQMEFCTTLPEVSRLQGEIAGLRRVQEFQLKAKQELTILDSQ